MCGEVEDRLAKEWIKFELDVENHFIQAMQNISEVHTLYSLICVHIRE